MIDNRGRIVGEARRYDPYSNRGEIMFYEMDSFGFIDGYLRDGWTVMSEFDLMHDKKMKEQLECIKYDDWKRHNLSELKERWNNYGCKYYDFEAFCRELYMRMDDKK